jgi:hypothetical protein
MLYSVVVEMKPNHREAVYLSLIPRGTLGHDETIYLYNDQRWREEGRETRHAGRHPVGDPALFVPSARLGFLFAAVHPMSSAAWTQAARSRLRREMRIGLWRRCRNHRRSSPCLPLAALAPG